MSEEIRKSRSRKKPGAENTDTETGSIQSGDSGTGSAAGSEIGSAAGSETGKNQNTEISRPDMVEIPLPVPGEGKKSRKKKEAPAPPATPLIGSGEISAVLSGISQLAAMKFGSHWNVSLDEAATVAQPLSNMLEKANLLEKVAKVSDGVMLLMAAASITIPRIMIQANINAVEAEKRKVAVLNAQKRNTAAENNAAMAGDEGDKEIKSGNGEFIKSYDTTGNTSY